MSKETTNQFPKFYQKAISTPQTMVHLAMIKEEMVMVEVQEETVQEETVMSQETSNHVDQDPDEIPSQWERVFLHKYHSNNQTRHNPWEILFHKIKDRVSIGKALWIWKISKRPDKEFMIYGQAMNNTRKGNKKNKMRQNNRRPLMKWEINLKPYQNNSPINNTEMYKKYKNYLVIIKFNRLLNHKILIRTNCFLIYYNIIETYYAYI